jgi:hypothetical protein
MAKLAIILGVPIALLATVASLGVVVVDVREAALAVAPAVAPAHEMRLPDEALEHMDLARDVLEALAAAPDGELVRVEERDELVVVSKQGRSLRVRVSGERENVNVNVPLHLVLQALPDEHGHIRTAALAGALGGVRFTDLVEVQDGNDHVHVYVW